MDEELKHLKETLKRLECPPGVMDRVRERIAAAEARRPHRSGRRLATALACAAVAVAALLLVPKPSPPVGIAPATATLSPDERLAVVQEARLAFAVFGGALQQALERSEPILLKQAVEPLQDNLHYVKNKLALPL